MGCIDGSYPEFDLPWFDEGLPRVEVGIKVNNVHLQCSSELQLSRPVEHVSKPLCDENTEKRNVNAFHVVDEQDLKRVRLNHDLNVWLGERSKCWRQMNTFWFLAGT